MDVIKKINKPLFSFEKEFENLSKKIAKKESNEDEIYNGKKYMKKPLFSFEKESKNLPKKTKKSDSDEDEDEDDNEKDKKSENKTKFSLYDGTSDIYEYIDSFNNFLANKTKGSHKIKKDDYNKKLLNDFPVFDDTKPPFEYYDKLQKYEFALVSKKGDKILKFINKWLWKKYKKLSDFKNIRHDYLPSVNRNKKFVIDNKQMIVDLFEIDPDDKTIFDANIIENMVIIHWIEKYLERMEFKLVHRVDVLGSLDTIFSIIAKRRIIKDYSY